MPVSNLLRVSNEFVLKYATVLVEIILAWAPIGHFLGLPKTKQNIRSWSGHPTGKKSTTFWRCRWLRKWDCEDIFCAKKEVFKILWGVQIFFSLENVRLTISSMRVPVWGEGVEKIWRKISSVCIERSPPLLWWPLWVKTRRKVEEQSFLLRRTYSIDSLSGGKSLKRLSDNPTNRYGYDYPGGDSNFASGCSLHLAEIELDIGTANTSGILLYKNCSIILRKIMNNMCELGGHLLAG